MSHLSVLAGQKVQKTKLHNTNFDTIVYKFDIQILSAIQFFAVPV